MSGSNYDIIPDLEKNNQPLILGIVVIGAVLIIALALIFTRNGDESVTETVDENNTSENQENGNGEENGQQPAPNPAPQPIPPQPTPKPDPTPAPDPRPGDRYDPVTEDERWWPQPIADCEFSSDFDVFEAGNTVDGLGNRRWIMSADESIEHQTGLTVCLLLIND